MEDKIKGYVHFAKYLKEGKEHLFEHKDIVYDYEAECEMLHSEDGKENLFTFLKMHHGAEEIIDFGLKEVEVDRVRTLKGIVEDNGGQTADEFAVVVGKTEIEDYLMRTYYGQEVEITVRILK